MTLNYTITTESDEVTVQVETEVTYWGCPATRWHDGDPPEVEIGTVEADGEEVKGPIRKTILLHIGYEEIEIDALQMAQK